MIKFFRKIRGKLITENKISKYLLYAIGEIILVVIGILIALKINNNNLENKTRELEKDYLTSLGIEFENNILKLEESNKMSVKIENSLIQALKFFDPLVLDTIDKDIFNNCLFVFAGSEVNFEPSNGVISDIINSGKLNIISNKKLRHKLASYNSDINKVEKHIKWQSAILKEIQNQFKTYGSMRTLLKETPHNSIMIKTYSGNDNKNLFSAISFENNILDYFLTNKVFIEGHFPVLKESLNELISVINIELEEIN